MKNKEYDVNRDKIKSYLLLTFLILITLLVFNNIKKITKKNDKKIDFISQNDLRLKGNGEYSSGYDHGDIYSIDGMKISDEIDIIVDEPNTEEIETQSRFCGIPEFTSILGIEGFGEGGVINQCYTTLHSTARESNIEARRGNDLQTTLHSKAQSVASKLLRENFPDTLCDGASVVIVLKDGTVICAAGSNCFSADEFNLNDTEMFPRTLCIDLTSENNNIGSSGKGITAATFLLNNEDFDKEYSLYNTEFEDLSFFTHSGTTISNHDYWYPANYDNIVDYNTNLMSRNIGLEEALVFSSNTYFWRHALHLGLKNSYKKMDAIFNISTPITTEINTIPGVSVDRDRLDYFFWGQDMSVSTVKLASMYNYAISGEYYNPFYITGVTTPDGEYIYKAKPEKIAEFNSKETELLKTGLSECFNSYCNNMWESTYSSYTDLIEDGRILAKSGTAEIVLNELTNHTRAMTILDEDKDVVCTAVIAVNRATNDCPINDNLLFSILIQTLEAADIL